MSDTQAETKAADEAAKNPPPYRTQPESPAIVSMTGIGKTFFRGKEPVKVLDDLDLDVPEGSFEALMGPSGSGKSTLLNLIAGLDRPTRGKITVAGTGSFELLSGPAPGSKLVRMPGAALRSGQKVKESERSEP